MDFEEFKSADLNRKKQLINEVAEILEDKIKNQIKNINKYIIKLENISSGNNSILESRKSIILG
jgi:hypothetical protein